MEGRPQQSGVDSQVVIPVDSITLEGNLTIPSGAPGVVLFAHGSGSSRHSPRNQLVAAELNRAGLGTLLMDLLTAEEERVDAVTRRLRFDIALLSQRLVGAIDWLTREPATRDRRIGLFGASTGAAAALVAAARRPEAVAAIVSRGGRPDLADEALPLVEAPTLLIVGGNDNLVIDLNEMAAAKMRGEKRLALVPGATHLFEEPGALEEVARLARDWFVTYLRRGGSPGRSS